MSEYPIIGWKEINGVQVPFAKPQHKTGPGINDYEETGYEHNLPTKDAEVAGKLDELKVAVTNNKTNLPTEYPDSLVKSELEAINAKLDGKTEVTNLPSNQPVTDAGVKSELELIKATQGEIITALQSTNESLLATNNNLTSVITDGRLQSDAQVTGSIAELDELKQLQVKTINKIGKSVETLNLYDVIEVPAGTTVVLSEHDFPCELVAMSVGSNSDRMSLRLESKTNGNYDSGIRLVNPNGLNANPVSPATLRLIDGENDFWNEFVYDAEGERFAYGMKRSLVFAKGMRIRLSAHSSKNANVSVTYVIQKLPEVDL